MLMECVRERQRCLEKAMQLRMIATQIVLQIYHIQSIERQKQYSRAVTIRHVLTLQNRKGCCQLTVTGHLNI